MLYELFSWMCAKDESPVFHQETITLLGFNSEHELGLKRRKQLLVEFRSAKFGSSPPQVLSESVKCLEEHDAYMRFMAACQQDLTAHGEANSLILALKYLLSLSENGHYSDATISSINKVFLLLLKEEKETALDFYTKNKGELDKCKPINVAVELAIATDQTVAYLAQLTPLLSGEENAVTLAPLFFPLIDDTEKFAAAVLWLSQRVPAKRILQTNLLQKFMDYHAAFLNSDDSPIRQLYQLLNQFSDTKELVEAAGHVACEGLGLGFNAYAITGDRPAPELLEPLEIMPPALFLRPSVENFDTLYRLFGFDLLKLAIEGYAEYQSVLWRGILFDFLNRDKGQLSEFINHIAAQVPTKLEVLASLITDESVANLITQHNGAVLHLLPYKPALLNQLSSCNIISYLEEVRSGDTPVFHLLSQFMTLFEVFCGVNKSAAALVYEVILDLALERLDLVEDMALKKLLKKFSAKDRIVTAKCEQLEAKFDEFIDAQVAQAPLNIDSYHVLEDCWHNISQQLHALNSLTSITHHCPRNKYAFQVYIAKAYLFKYPDYFNLDDFFQALEIPQEFSEGSINQYEQLLIEILTAIDNEALRAEIIQRLETYKATGLRWMDRDYGGENVFFRAVRQNNVGIVEWLDANLCLSPAALKSAAFIAAETAQWKVVQYLCESCPLSQTTYKSILVFAAEGGQLGLVQYLCNYSIKRLQGKNILQAFVCAARNGNVNIMQFLWDLNHEALNATMLANVLKIAAQHGHLESITFLGNLIESPILQCAVESILMHAVAHNQVIIIEQLCHLLNGPRLEVIEKAFIRAIKTGNLPLARYFCSLPGVALRQNIIDEGLDLAVKCKSFHAIGFMFDLKLSYPSYVAAEQALYHLVNLKRLDCVRLLCGLKPSLFREQSIETALFLAIKSDALPIMVYLSTLVRPHVTAKAFQWAAQYGTLDMLMYCLKLNPPDHLQIQSASRQASSNKHTETKNYLHNLISFTTRRCPEFLQFSVVSVSVDRTSGIRRRASCSDLSQYGFFNSQESRRRNTSSSDFLELSVSPV